MLMQNVDSFAKRDPIFPVTALAKIRINYINLCESELLFYFYITCIGITFIYIIVLYDIHIVRKMVYLY